jgi:hypothetical protein
MALFSTLTHEKQGRITYHLFAWSEQLSTTQKAVAAVLLVLGFAECLYLAAYLYRAPVAFFAPANEPTARALTEKRGLAVTEDLTGRFQQQRVLVRTFNKRTGKPAGWSLRYQSVPPPVVQPGEYAFRTKQGKVVKTQLHAVGPAVIGGIGE